LFFYGISIFQNPGNPGNPGKSILVMESHGKLKFYITSAKYFTCFNLPVITII
jgi:hypothetical protein